MDFSDCTAGMLRVNSPRDAEKRADGRGIGRASFMGDPVYAGSMYQPGKRGVFE